METWQVAVLCLVIALVALTSAVFVFGTSGLSTTVVMLMVTGLFFAALGVIIAIVSFASMLKRIEATLLKK
jgi:VIT1/CCC1 family predicted Fe2+/Mn2+ transporter